MTREDDERILRWIALRMRGYTTPQIANRFGVKQSVVRLATNKVRAADQAESGEPVAGAYW